MAGGSLGSMAHRSNNRSAKIVVSACLAAPGGLELQRDTFLRWINAPVNIRPLVESSFWSFAHEPNIAIPA
jgi:hypothetical protein